MGDSCKSPVPWYKLAHPQDLQVTESVPLSPAALPWGPKFGGELLRTWQVPGS